MGCAGDMNCAHTELDIHNPKSNLKSAGFTPVRRYHSSTARAKLNAMACLQLNIMELAFIQGSCQIAA